MKKLDEMQELAAAAMKAATAAARAFRVALKGDKADLESKTTHERARAFYAYFDQSKAFSTVDGFKTIDAAITAHYNLTEGDKEALKTMRDHVTHLRRVGAKLAGTTLGKGGSKTTVPGVIDFTSVDKYLSAKFGKLSLADQCALLKKYKALYLAAHAAAAEAEAAAEAAKAEAEAAAKTEAPAEAAA